MKNRHRPDSLQPIHGKKTSRAWSLGRLWTAFWALWQPPSPVTKSQPTVTAQTYELADVEWYSYTWQSASKACLSELETNREWLESLYQKS